MARHEGAPPIQWTEEVPLQKKKLTGFSPLHFENRQFLPFVIFYIYFFQTYPPLWALAMTLKIITGQDNYWMTVDLPEASDRSRPIA